MKLVTKKENVRLIEEVAPKLRDVVKVDFELEDNIALDYTVYGKGDLVSVDLKWRTGAKSSDLVDTAEKKPLNWKYIAGGVLVAGAVTTIAILIANSSSPQPGEIYEK